MKPQKPFIPNILLILLIAVFQLTGLQAQMGPNFGEASAAVITGFKINNAHIDLDFGSIVPHQTQQGIVVMTWRSRRSNPDGRLQLVAFNAGHAASFRVYGLPGQTYTITLPANGTVVLEGPGEDMPVYNFESFPFQGPWGQLGIQSGTELLRVGARLIVGPDQQPGQYTGVFEIRLEGN